MTGLVFFNKLFDCLLRILVGTSSGSLDYDGLGDLTSSLVGYGDHGTVGDCWMSQEMGFKLGGCDLQSLFFIVDQCSVSVYRLLFPAVVY